MAEGPLDIFGKIDPQLLNHINGSRDSALAEGALSKKFKLLMAMALDASEGTTTGVKSLAQQALKAGATQAEVIEALRVAYYICGVGCVYTAAPAFKEIFG